MNPTRLARPLLLWLLLASRLLAADPATLPQVADLRQLGETAETNHIPILLLVSQYHCDFCERMKRDVLNPMQFSGEYADQVLMRELLIDPGEMVTDFQGHRQPADAFSTHYNVHVTPTLLFLDGQGNEVAERILGINTVDYLLLYIEDAIETASQNMTR
jgi:thioredoxin-related protein